MIGWISLILMIGSGISILIAAIKCRAVLAIISIACLISSSLLIIYGAYKDGEEKCQHDLITWNDGYHENCGGRWEFCQVEYGYRVKTIGYIYKCDKCYKVEVFSNIME